MDTKKVSISKVCSESEIPSVKYQIKMRTTPLREWLKESELANRLSGTLRKNARIGFKHMDQLKHEALCQTLGWGWECCPSSYVTFNDAITEGDSHSLTECGWHADRWLTQHLFPEDQFELKYIIIDSVGVRKEGVGLICRESSISWIGEGVIVFALLSEFKDNKWVECLNPF